MAFLGNSRKWFECLHLWIAPKSVLILFQRYKEGRVILERALVTEQDGLEEYVPVDCAE